MAKKKPITETTDAIVASFKSPEVAALFGLTTKDTGTITYHNPDIVTVEFEGAKAVRVSASLFVVVEPAKENDDASED